MTLLLATAFVAIEAILAYVLPSYLDQFSAQLLQIEFFQSILKALLGTDVGDMLGPEALSALAWVHPVVLAIVWTQAVVFCTRVPAGEIDRGTIDVFFSLPVSRWAVYLAETVVFLAAGVLLLVMGLLGHRLGIISIDPANRPALSILLAVAINFYCLYLAVGGMAFLVSSLSDRRGRAIGIIFAILLASFLLNFLAQFWVVADHLSFLSVLSYYQPLVILRSSGSLWSALPLGDMAVLAAIGMALWTAGGVCLARRDICTV